jgi:gamma-glutamylcyclotransferase (GGCT)/AIG2-like uncharacterized protein YtfP
MLNIKEQTIKELDELKPQALAKVYDLITATRGQVYVWLFINNL